jgi:hypothetical protein
MATYKAEIKTVPTGSSYTVTVESGSISTAKQEIEHLYKPIYIRNLRQVSNSNSSSSSGVGDIGGTVGLIGLVAAGWAFVSFTPWILMGLGGALGTWIGEKVTGQSVEEYTQLDDDSGHSKAAIVLALALLLGGVGFVKGDEIKKSFDTPDAPAQVKQTSKGN